MTNVSAAGRDVDGPAPIRRKKKPSANLVRGLVDRFLLAVETKHDELLAAIQTGRDGELRTWIDVNRQVVQRRLNDLERVLGNEAIAAIRASLDAYTRLVRDVVDARTDSMDKVALQAEFTKLTSATNDVADAVSRAEERRAFFWRAGTVLAAWTGTLVMVIGSGILANVGTRGRAALARRAPAPIRAVVEDLSIRETQPLYEGEPCKIKDQAFLDDSAKGVAGLTCRAWNVPAWRPLVEGIALIPERSSGQVTIQVRLTIPRQDKGRITARTVTDADINEKVLCVRGMEIGDEVRLLVWFTYSGTDSISARAVRVSQLSDEGKLCAPR